MLIRFKPARKPGLWTSLLATAWLVGCQQNTMAPPVSDVSTESTTTPERAPETAGARFNTRELSRTDLNGSDRFISSIQSAEPDAAAADRVKEAETALAANQPQVTINALQGIQLEGLEANERAEVLRLKSESLQQLNLTLAALRVRAERLQYIDQPVLDRELRELTEAVTRLSPTTQTELALGTDLLAGLAQAIRLRGDSQSTEAQRWLRRFSEHPVLQSRLSRFQFLQNIVAPETFHAVALLPLTGDLANAGKAIRDGMLYQHAKRSTSIPIRLDIRDSASMTEADWAELAANTDIDLIIGPLPRAQIATLLAAAPKAPVLTLNRLDSNTLDVTGPVYSFSLAIEDDAQSAVDYAGMATNAPRLLTFYTESDLGRRTAEATRLQLTRIGGTLAGNFPLDAEKPEITIAQAFGVTDSEARRREISRAINLPLEYTPRIRTDLTAVVLQTDTNRARQIRPLLDFYYLEDTPVLLIGAYRADLSEMTEDFKRSYLLVTPWELGSSARMALNSRPWVQSPFGTLTGVGVDAMELAVRLGFGEPIDFTGQTGHLSLGESGVIERRLSVMAIDGRERITEVPWQPTRQPLRYKDTSNAR